MRKITSIKVWKEETKERRIYISFENEKNDGIYFLTGNKYNSKGSLKNMSEEEKTAAGAICEALAGKKVWCDVYNVVSSKKINKDEENLDVKSRGFIPSKNMDFSYEG